MISRMLTLGRSVLALAGSGTRVGLPSGRASPPAGLRVTDISVTYANGVRAIESASFELGASSICALVGINGSGKSTLFKTLMGFLTPSSGSVAISGLPVGEALARGLVAYVPQSEDVDWTFPVLVRDVVMMGRYGHMNALRMACGTDHAAVSAALDRVGLSAFADRQIGELSGGQRKRVFLARAQVGDRRVAVGTLALF